MDDFSNLLQHSTSYTVHVAHMTSTEWRDTSRIFLKHAYHQNPHMTTVCAVQL